MGGDSWVSSPLFNNMIIALSINIIIVSFLLYTPKICAVLTRRRSVVLWSKRLSPHFRGLYQYNNHAWVGRRSLQGQQGSVGVARHAKWCCYRFTPGLHIQLVTIFTWLCWVLEFELCTIVYRGTDGFYYRVLNNILFLEKNLSKIEKVFIVFSILDKIFPKTDLLIYALRAYINRTPSI